MTTATATQPFNDSKTQLYPWLIWSLGAAFVFYNYLLQVAPSIISQELMGYYQVNAGSLGHLGACYFYTYLLMQIPVGLLLDRYGLRVPTTLAILTASFGTVLFALSESFFVACLARAIIGLGGAFSAVSCLKLCSMWFPPHRFPLMAGLMMTVAMLGAMSGGGPLAYMASHYGWRETVMFTASFGVILAAVYWVLVRDSDGRATPETQTDVVAGLKQIMRCPQTWILSLYSGLAFAPVSAFGGLWGIPFIAALHNLSTTQAASQVGLVFLGFAIGAPLSGYVADTAKKQWYIMLIGTVLALLSLSAAIYLPLSINIELGLALFGFGFFASFFMLCFNMIKDLHSAVLAGTAIGFMNSFDALVGAITEPLIGGLLDLSWAGEALNGARVFSLHAYHVALSCLPLYFFISVVLVLFIKQRQNNV